MWDFSECVIVIVIVIVIVRRDLGGRGYRGNFSIRPAVFSICDPSVKPHTLVCDVGRHVEVCLRLRHHDVGGLLPRTSSQTWSLDDFTFSIFRHPPAQTHGNVEEVLPGGTQVGVDAVAMPRANLDWAADANITTNTGGSVIIVPLDSELQKKVKMQPTRHFRRSTDTGSRI